jgi:hypothetical protein
MAENLMDGLLSEMNRAREVKAMYDEIPQGKFGSIMIQQSIERAERSIKDNDVVAMLQAYNDLKEIE